jgi:hypothetical protein
MYLKHAFLDSLKQNDHMNWHIVTTELIDNALDAHAQEIAVGWKKRLFTVFDDGIGVSPEGFEALYTLGGHVKSVANTKTIGRYGVGFKEAAGWLWGTTTIRSRHRESGSLVHQLRINWEHEMRYGDTAGATLPLRLIKDPKWPNGTEIRCDNILRPPPSREVFDRLTTHLAHVYHPALTAGCRIILARQDEEPATLAPSPWPAAAVETPRAEGTILVAGRAVHVVAYVTADDPAFPGLHVATHGRVMDRITSKRNARRLYGWVTLGDGWEVAKNKTAITDPHREELWAKIAEFCKAVFDAAEKEADRVQLTALATTATYALRNALKAQHLVPGYGGRRRPVITHGPDKPRDGDKRKRIPRPPPRHDDNNPDAKESKAPYVEFHFGNVTTGELATLDATSTMWTVVGDQTNEAFIEFVKEPCLGARGPDPSRLIQIIIHRIAASAVTNPVIAAALPRLEGVPQDQIYGVASTLLWNSYLATRTSASTSVTTSEGETDRT